MMIVVRLLWQREPCEVLASLEGPRISIDLKRLLPCIYQADDNDSRCGAPRWDKICPESSLAPLVNDRTCLIDGVINKADSPGLSREWLWPRVITFPSPTDMPAPLQWRVNIVAFLVPLTDNIHWQEILNSHSGCYFLWLLWPPRLCFLFLDLQKCQDGQVSVTGSLGLRNNSWGICNSERLNGSAFTEP